MFVQIPVATAIAIPPIPADHIVMRMSSTPDRHQPDRADRPFGRPPNRNRLIEWAIVIVLLVAAAIGFALGDHVIIKAAVAFAGVATAFALVMSAGQP